VYCRCRERWEPNGHEVFSVEHIQAQGRHPEQAGDYDNLVYACSVCNACRRDVPLPFDPSVEAMAWHIQTLPDGTIEPLTRAGRKLCDLCHLNRPLLVQFRRDSRELLELLASRHEPKEQLALRRILGFPEDLPNLRANRPPGRNSRPEALLSCYFEQRKRGELAQVY